MSLNTYDTSLIQENIWSMQQIDPASSVHNTACLFKIEGDFDFERFKSAVAKTLQANKILATKYNYTEFSLRQSVNTSEVSCLKKKIEKLTVDFFILALTGYSIL